MGQIVAGNAVLSCTFGTAPSTLNVTSQTKCMAGTMPAATIQDVMPNTNIMPFGMCTSMANPQVAAATAAALGVLTPQPCMMIPAGVWIGGKMEVTAAGLPCLTSDAKLICTMGAGNISITVPGQAKITV